MSIYESDVEREMLSWFNDLDYEVVQGPDIAPDGVTPERRNYKQAILTERLESALHRFNPNLPGDAIRDTVSVLTHGNVPGQIVGNREFHRWLVTGVQVFWQQDGETKSTRVQVIDFDDPSRNDWLVANQFTVFGSRERRPDAVVFLNGLPIAVIELKNAASEQADVWAAFQQLQTYKEDIPELFRSNELLIASDGVYARLGSISANAERFTAWRTIDGEQLDPLGRFAELETMVRGVFRKDFLLDYIRHFVLFEDDGTLTKKIAA